MLTARRRQSGFTILEMTIVIAIVSALGALSIASLRGVKRSSDTRNATRQMLSAIGNARAVAMRLGGAVQAGRVVRQAGCPSDFLHPAGFVRTGIRLDTRSGRAALTYISDAQRIAGTHPPQFEAFCKTLDVVRAHKDVVELDPSVGVQMQPGHLPGTYFADIDGRGFLRQAPTGPVPGVLRFGLRSVQPPQVPQTVLVLLSGVACIESTPGRCVGG